MSRRYLRLYELRVNDSPVLPARSDRNLRLTFEIDIDFGGVNSYADISLFNLSAAGRSRYRKGSKVSLLAGYEGDFGVIFSGKVQNIFPGRSGPSTETRLLCRGAVDRPVINRAFGPQVTAYELLRAIAETLDVKLNLVRSDFSSTDEYPGGYSMSGDAIRYLDSLSRAHGFEYSLSADQLVVVKSGQARPGPAEVIDQFSGMEGIPTVTEIGADVSVRISPRFRIGGTFRVESTLKTFNFSNVYFQDVPESAGTGDYRIQRIQYSGDSHGDPWTAALTGVRST